MPEQGEYKPKTIGQEMGQTYEQSAPNTNKASINECFGQIKPTLAEKLAQVHCEISKQVIQQYLENQIEKLKQLKAELNEVTSHIHQLDNKDIYEAVNYVDKATLHLNRYLYELKTSRHQL